ncbi:histamine H2 receptor-like [Asterias amurensis]|uniref:histamine H2 receptor-like n=1 Tax=Asterias amurensis TaxID=7602 RepID=UPI003AB360B7
MDENGSNSSQLTRNKERGISVCQDTLCVFTFVLFFITIALIVILNSVCLVVLRKVRGIPETTKLFMMSLTLSDLCTGMFYGIPILYYFMSTSSITSATYCKILPFIIITLVTINASSMVMLTIDRFLAITYSLHYPRLMTLKRSKVMVTLVWTLTLVIYSACFYILDRSRHKEMSNKHVFLCGTQSNLMLFLFIAITVVSLGTILTLYAYILKVARCQARLIAAQNILGNIEGRQNVPGPISTKSATTVIIITGTACLCWIPLIITASLLLGNITGPTSIYLIANTLFSSNCWLNCIIYYWRNREFRQTLHNFRSSCCH